jgi:hypothetical protein
MKRRDLIFSSAILLSLVCGPFLLAQESVGTDPSLPVPSVFEKDQTDIAIDRAIAYLLRQQRADGAILDKGTDTTMTALSIMAMARAFCIAWPSGLRSAGRPGDAEGPGVRAAG